MIGLCIKSEFAFPSPYYMHHAGGDQMTAARIRSSQHLMSNSENDIKRLKGLTGIVEDWHAKVVLLEVGDK